ncbi:T9SS type A sorting domain-containing protein [Aquimarina algiphila]|uniref:T9SS type A sorting domain-containing protein n=1 Tax=Aquimarina algiphila TaxID=2047982 RepID=UPI002491D0E6|nr:T9SS type A sorting domain-containing protein [Aquimarina algiphila]
MKSKIHFFLMMAIMAICSQVFAQRPSFNKNKDILIACFDIKPDPDDIHAVAALGSMLAHPDLTGVEYFAVAGAYGSQGGSYLQSNSLFNMAFGNNWTDAHSNRSAAIAAITSKVVPILQNGGKVWVQEGGQSDVTADWLMPVINASNGINSNTTKNNVILVQHDDGFNEGQANQSKLNNVKANTRYFLLDDGNAGWNDGWGDHGPWSTPMYRNRSNSFVDQAKNSPNSVAKALWTEADRIFNNYFPNGFPHDWSFFFTDGVDYSDCVENWWIFEIGSNADTHDKFWSRYVMNTTSNPGPNPNPNQQFFIVNRQTGKKLRPQNNADGITLIQVPASTTSNIVKWEQVNTSNGYFYLKNVETGKYFRPVGNNDGSALEQRPTSYSGNYTQWKKVNSSNGYFYLQNRQTNHYFRPTTDSDNSPMVQRPTTYSGNYTQWKFDAVGSKTSALEDNKIAIYPNPASSQLKILGIAKQDIISVKDLSGKIVIKEVTSIEKNMNLDVSRLQNGVYVLTVKNANKNTTLQFVKK